MALLGPRPRTFRAREQVKSKTGVSPFPADGFARLVRREGACGITDRSDNGRILAWDALRPGSSGKCPLAYEKWKWLRANGIDIGRYPGDPTFSAPWNDEWDSPDDIDDTSPGWERNLEKRKRIDEIYEEVRFGS